MVWFPTQMTLEPVIETALAGFTEMITDESEIQPEKVLVKTNRAVPEATPVICPALEIEAIPIFELDQVPPVEGSICVVSPGQMLFGPSKSMAGLSLTTTDKSWLVIQPKEFVNLSEATPGATAFTVPDGDIFATDGWSEVHVPPVEGFTLVC